MSQSFSQGAKGGRNNIVIVSLGAPPPLDHARMYVPTYVTQPRSWGVVPESQKKRDPISPHPRTPSHETCERHASTEAIAATRRRLPAQRSQRSRRPIADLKWIRARTPKLA